MLFKWWNGVISIQEFIKTPLIYLAVGIVGEIGNLNFIWSVYYEFENLCHSLIFDRVSFLAKQILGHL